MANHNCPQLRLADLCDSIDYGYTESASSIPSDHRFLRITDIVKGYIDWHNVPFCNVDEKTADKYKLHHGDIVIARTGATTGASAYISNPPDTIFASYLVRLKINKQNDSRFISYFLRSPEFWKYMRGVLGDKSAQPNASARTITQVKLNILPLHEQKATASILGALDDKIELNRKMNETLEAMARTIFKSWFVDFDPILGVGPHKEWQDSQLGRIPKGWRVGSVGEEFNLTMGQSPPGETYNEVEEGLPFFQGRRDFGFRYPTLRVYCTSPTRIANVGDTLVCVRAPVGDVNMAYVKCCVGRGLAAIRHKSASRSYTYYTMKRLKETFDRFEAEGTVFGSITKLDFQNVYCIVPPYELIEKFEDTAFPLDQCIERNEQQSRTLFSIRDVLLPKLLSGEMRVKDAEKFVEIFT